MHGRLHDPDDPAPSSAAIAVSLGHCSPAVRAAVERIVDAPREHLWRKLAIVLDGIAARRPV
ncbi:hypothetical protein [Nonomuraea sp. SYSU D8015]|uniref:hypothetical protein n=1 Tax=Nonomuraea sp. SYSU D8015 TaxID=2593644 RepID=UPI001660CF16|nr:hypothetical protein [Nonomuraea sp. SYSU D8015]